MSQIFLIIYFVLFLLGLFFLVYYARFREDLNFDFVITKKKPKLPLAIKIYALVLLLWIVISTSYYFIEIINKST